MTRVAAIQMHGKVADIAYNLGHVRELLTDAVQQGAKVIALPEFFTTPIVQDERLWGCALPPENPALAMLREFAMQHQALIGGSYLEMRGQDVYNCYTLVRPDGSVTRHDKDLPTMIENAYYTGGNDDGWHETELGRVGTAVCWETIRTQTVKRLAGRVDFLMTGSHWWAPPQRWKPVAGFMAKMDTMNRAYMLETPGRLARLLGVANLHAAHCGALNGSVPVLPQRWASLPFHSYLLGETQIIDNQGRRVARLAAEDGPGVIAADIDLTPGQPSDALPQRFWIPQLAWRFKLLWWQQNYCGKRLYRKARSQQRLQQHVLARR